MMENYHPGEIWEMTSQMGVTSKVLIAAVQAGFVNTFPVYENDFSNTLNFQLQNGREVDTRKMAWTKFSLLSNPIGSVTGEEFDGIMEQFAENVGLSSERQGTHGSDWYRREAEIWREAFNKVVSR